MLTYLGPSDYALDSYEAEVRELRREVEQQRRYETLLTRAPDCRDPAHPGCPRCEECGEEVA